MLTPLDGMEGEKAKFCVHFSVSLPFPLFLHASHIFVQEAEMSRELELCLRYVREVTRSGKAELMPAALAALLDLPLKAPHAAPNRLAAYNTAAVALLQWADGLFIGRVIREPPLVSFPFPPAFD